MFDSFYQIFIKRFIHLNLISISVWLTLQLVLISICFAPYTTSDFQLVSIVSFRNVVTAIHIVTRLSRKSICNRVFVIAWRKRFGGSNWSPIVLGRCWILFGIVWRWIYWTLSMLFDSIGCVVQFLLYVFLLNNVFLFVIGI